jgi:DNA-binding transcriptional MocR family regulator
VPVIDKLVAAKQSADLHTSTFAQYIINEVAQDGFLETHVVQMSKAYRERRASMLAAMERYFPAEVSWSHPAAGLFLMVYLPQHLPSEFFQRRPASDRGGHQEAGSGPGKRINFPGGRDLECRSEPAFAVLCLA